MPIHNKDIKSSKEKLGQFFTDSTNVDFCLSKINIKNDILYIEPSFGNGQFINKMLNFTKNIIGIELDENLYNLVDIQNKLNINFYDFNYDFKNQKICFIGNPPFSTPAYSLETHNKYIKKLCKKYDIIGIKEESVFFLLKTIDIIEKNNLDNIDIYYILPKTLFESNTKFYNNFKLKILNKLKIENMWDLPNIFDKTGQSFVYVHFSYNKNIDNNEFFYYNDIVKSVKDFFFDDNDIIYFFDIFKKTYLGSVPAESIFLSLKNETLLSFKERLKIIFNNNIDEKNIFDLFSNEGNYNLFYLKNKNENKIKNLIKNINTIKNDNDFNKFILYLNDDNNYKSIKHRKDDRYYFRHEYLKKFSPKNFIYIINTNPCKSFYFTGNPTNTSTDYFGFCDYDINRNSSPGACRTVPILNIEENITDQFKILWYSNFDIDIKYLFEYMIYISNSKWYKDRKKTNKRTYFGIPRKFDMSFLQDFI